MPPLPVLSVLLPGFGSGTGLEAVALLPVRGVLLDGLVSVSVAETVAVLSKEPGALIVAVTLTVTFAPAEMVAMLQGRAAQPPPLTLVMVRFEGVSVT